MDLSTPFVKMIEVFVTSEPSVLDDKKASETHRKLQMTTNAVESKLFQS